MACRRSRGRERVTPSGAGGLRSSRGGEGGIAGRAEGGLKQMAGAEGEELADGGLGPRGNDCKF